MLKLIQNLCACHRAVQMPKAAAKKGRSTRGVDPNIGKRELRVAARSLMLKKLKAKQKSSKNDTAISSPTKVTPNQGDVGSKVVGLETPPPREPVVVAPELMKKPSLNKKATSKKAPPQSTPATAQLPASNVKSPGSTPVHVPKNLFAQFSPTANVSSTSSSVATLPSSTPAASIQCKRGSTFAVSQVQAPGPNIVSPPRNPFGNRLAEAMKKDYRIRVVIQRFAVDIALVRFFHYKEAKEAFMINEFKLMRENEDFLQALTASFVLKVRGPNGHTAAKADPNNKKRIDYSFRQLLCGLNPEENTPEGGAALAQHIISVLNSVAEQCKFNNNRANSWRFAADLTPTPMATPDALMLDGDLLDLVHAMDPSVASKGYPDETLSSFWKDVAHARAFINEQTNDNSFSPTFCLPPSEIESSQESNQGAMTESFDPTSIVINGINNNDTKAAAVADVGMDMETTKVPDDENNPAEKVHVETVNSDDDAGGETLRSETRSNDSDEDEDENENNSFISKTDEVRDAGSNSDSDYEEAEPNIDESRLNKMSRAELLKFVKDLLD